MNTDTYPTHSPQETQQVATKLVPDLLSGPILVMLTGELGAGKTQFVQGLAHELGITEPIRSPSYLYMREYQIPRNQGNLYHYDLWRTQDQDTLDLLAISAGFHPGGITVVEWANRMDILEKVASAQQVPVIKVDIRIVDEDSRIIAITR